MGADREGTGSQTLRGLEGHLKNSALCTDWDEKPLEGLGQRSAAITHPCYRMSPPLWGEGAVRGQGQSRETRDHAAP